MGGKINKKLAIALVMSIVLVASFAFVPKSCAQSEDTAVTESEIERLRKELKNRPDNPENITIEYRLATLIRHRTDPKTHEYIVTNETRQMYEQIVSKYEHMDYYSKDQPNYPRSPQIIVPECAIAAGLYQKDHQKARQYYYKAIECLNQTYQQRKKDWQTAPASKKPAEDSPFGGLEEVAKWQSRMFRWNRKKLDAASGNVLHHFELQLMKRAVKLYLLSYLSEYGDRNYPSFNQDKVGKAMKRILKDFPDTPIADCVFEYGDIIVNVLDKVHIVNK